MIKCMMMSAGLAVFTLPAVAQEIPRTLAECGGIFEALFEFQPPEGNHGHIENAASVFRNKASSEADGPSGVTEANATYEDTLSFWRSQGAESATTDEFESGMVRCREFADEIQLDLGL